MEYMFEKYASYRVGDFVQDEHFLRWIQTPDAESDRFWHDFQETFPYQRPVIRQAILAVRNLAVASQIPADQTQSVEIWDRLQRSMEGTQTRKNWWRGAVNKAAIAAFALVGLGALGYLFHDNKAAGNSYADSVTAPSLIEMEMITDSRFEKITNQTGAPKTIVLPDHSEVRLSPGSTIRYDREFVQDSRSVFLIGEAFFKVTKDAERPFFVHSNGLTTKVLGTSFLVKSEEGSDRVQVIVQTGKVSVFTSPKKPGEDLESQGLILRANQQVDYSRSIEKFTRSLVPDPVPVLPPEEIQAFVFSNAPASDIFEALGKVYDAEILFDPDIFSECRLNSVLDDDVSLFEKLDVVCEAIGASYKVVDAQIVITGRKCS